MDKNKIAEDIILIDKIENRVIHYISDKPFLMFLWDVKEKFFKDDGMAYAAQIAYFFSLSVFPLIIFILSMTSRVNVEYSDLIANLEHQYGFEASEMFSVVFDDWLMGSSVAVISIAGILTLFSASRAIVALMKALDVVYEVESKRIYPVAKFWAMIYTLLFSVMIVIMLVFPILSEKFINMVESSLNIYFLDNISLILNLVRSLSFLLVTSVTFGSIYVHIPNKKIKYKDVGVGAVFSIVAIFISMFIYTIAMNRFMNLSVIYGSLSTFVALMIWLYIVGAIIIIGGEMNAVRMKNKTYNIQ